MVRRWGSGFRLFEGRSLSSQEIWTLDVYWSVKFGQKINKMLCVHDRERERERERERGTGTVAGPAGCDP